MYLNVDVERNRVNLSMRPEGSEAPAKAPRQPRRDNDQPRGERKPQGKRPQQCTSTRLLAHKAKKPQSQQTTRAKNWWFRRIVITSRCERF